MVFFVWKQLLRKCCDIKWPVKPHARLYHTNSLWWNVAVSDIMLTRYHQPKSTIWPMGSTGECLKLRTTDVHTITVFYYYLVYITVSSDRNKVAFFKECSSNRKKQSIKLLHFRYELLIDHIQLQNQIYKIWPECSELNALEYMLFSCPVVVWFVSYEIEFLLNYIILWFQFIKFHYCHIIWTCLYLSQVTSLVCFINPKSLWFVLPCIDI